MFSFTSKFSAEKSEDICFVVRIRVPKITEVLFSAIYHLNPDLFNKNNRLNKFRWFFFWGEPISLDHYPISVFTFPGASGVLTGLKYFIFNEFSTNDNAD